MRVTEFPLSRLDPDCGNPFDPLSEAVVFRGESLRVNVVVDDAVARINDESLEINAGDQIEVAESMAMFLCLKGWAIQSR